MRSPPVDIIAFKMSRSFGDWSQATPEYMRNWPEEDLHAAMIQNRGGVHDVWARAEIERRHMQALTNATEQVHRDVERLTASSTTLETLTRTLKNLTWALILLTVLAAAVPIAIEIWKAHHEIQAVPSLAPLQPEVDEAKK
jgi:hypothetical protein